MKLSPLVVSVSTVLCLASLTAAATSAENPALTITVDAHADRRPISPDIYGVAYGDSTTLADLNVPLNRSGGNHTSCYNWQLNADNRGFDWYFESVPGGITVGPDGALWFTEGLGNRIGRITTAGVITEFPLPTANSGPGGITVGPDGALWFTEYQGNRIGRITTAGVITEFPTTGRGPLRIAAGPDGALWFTASDVEGNIGRIGRITTAGVITEFRTPSFGSWPLGIATGSDGALWFTEFNGEQIGRLRAAGSIFADVPADHPFATWIEALVTAGITGGCSTSPPQYCPDGTVTRGQMAVFLLRAKHGGGYSPPAARGTMFTDVPASQPFAPWIEALVAEGMASGCSTSPPQYCPDGTVTRAQMAVFLLRAKHGAGYSPPAATGTMFTDVPASQPLAKWIEQLAREGITGGCGATSYCPDASVTRAAMAVFLVRTFNPPM